MRRRGSAAVRAGDEAMRMRMTVVSDMTTQTRRDAWGVQRVTRWHALNVTRDV